MGTTPKETAKAIFETYVSNGGNFIDTACNYQNGDSETWLGEFISESKTVTRSDLVIATKYSLPHPAAKSMLFYIKKKTLFDIFPPFSITLRRLVNFCGNHRKNMIESVERSLTRLKTTYVDILYVHYFDATVDADMLMQTLNYLIVSGKVLFVAISDAPAWFVVRSTKHLSSLLRY
jgi:aryl-alcohol dehydrogenase-like predicted oxidoreductase